MLVMSYKQKFILKILGNSHGVLHNLYRTIRIRQKCRSHVLGIIVFGRDTIRAKVFM